jgi:hypothetical protein
MLVLKSGRRDSFGLVTLCGVSGGAFTTLEKKCFNHLEF